MNSLFFDLTPGEPPLAAVDHLLLVLPGPVPHSPLLSDLGYIGAAGQRGTFVDSVDSLRYHCQEMMASHFAGACCHAGFRSLRGR